MLRVSWEPTGDPVLDRLGQQFVERVACFARGGSYERRMEWHRKYTKFLRLLAERFGPEDICNIQPRHVAAFAKLPGTGPEQADHTSLFLYHPLVEQSNSVAEVRTTRKQGTL